MSLPFTQSQFLENFAKYNESIFPIQFIFITLAFIVLYLAIKNNKYSDKIISGILSFLWLWMGIVYHYTFFSNINKAAYLFGTLFIIQSILLAVFGIFKNKMGFSFQWDKYSKTGFILVIYALIVYPLLGYLFGHIYPQSPTFGVPCPSTIFTLGILLMATRPIKMVLLIIPSIWSLLSFSAVLTLGVKEDVGLIISGVIAIILVWIKNKRQYFFN